MAYAAGRGHSRAVNAGGKRHGKKHVQWARGMRGVCKDRYGGEGEHEAAQHLYTWVCVSLSSLPSESGAPTEHGTGASMGAVQPCSAIAGIVGGSGSSL